MIRFDEAIAIIQTAVRPLAVETVRLDEADGRVLARPVIAALDSPRSDVSAMDGYAIRSADLGTYPVSLKVAGQSRPGFGWSGALEPGTCIRIFTGAPLPEGADRIVIQEQVQRSGENAIIERDPGPATWVRPQGKDFRTGETLVPAGRRMDPGAIVAAAGADAGEVELFVRPRLVLISTGDELVEPGEARKSTLAVPDSVSPGIAALAAGWGGLIAERSRLADDLKVMEGAARKALELGDVIVVIGGASVGEHDFAKRMFEPSGLELLFSKVAIRPGMPAWFGQARGRLVLGLPGNPASALVTARLFLAPLLCALQGRPTSAALNWEEARIATPIPSCDGRETFHRASLSKGEASLAGFQQSHGQKVLGQSDWLVRQAANSPPLEIGETVTVLRL